MLTNDISIFKTKILIQIETWQRIYRNAIFMVFCIEYRPGILNVDLYFTSLFDIICSIFDIQWPQPTPKKILISAYRSLFSPPSSGRAILLFQEALINRSAPSVLHFIAGSLLPSSSRRSHGKILQPKKKL